MFSDLVMDVLIVVRIAFNLGADNQRPVDAVGIHFVSQELEGTAARPAPAAGMAKIRRTISGCQSLVRKANISVLPGVTTCESMIMGAREALEKDGVLISLGDT